jgi:DNA-binding transcriptional ArsR family regulator
VPIVAPQIAEVAQLVADPGRAKMLSSLMDGREKTAGELAAIAGVTPQTASAHLSKLVYRTLLTVEKRGPRRLYRLTGPLIAQMLEGIMTVAVTGPQPFRPPSKIDDQIRLASICYDHLTGRLGVAIADGLVEHRHLILDHDVGQFTASGAALLNGLGVDLQAPGRRAFCRLCLDWSQQRLHLAGRTGAAIAKLALRRDWIRHRPEGRSVIITDAGFVAFRTLFGAKI